MFNIQRSVRRKYIPFDIFTTRCNITQFIYFWKTTLHVSGGISTHHQEHIQLYLQRLVLIKPLLLPAAIVEELEIVFILVRLLIATAPKQIQFTQHTQTSSNYSTIAAGSSNGLTSIRLCKYSCVYAL